MTLLERLEQPEPCPSCGELRRPSAIRAHLAECKPVPEWRRRGLRAVDRTFADAGPGPSVQSRG